MSSPYEELPAQAYWRKAVADVGAHGLQALWTPKFAITPEDVIVTAGSCFAQHFSRALTAAGYGWKDFEPAPKYLPAEQAAEFGYGVFSFRTGNIYTPSMLLQWLRLAYAEIPDPVEVWEGEDGIRDPLRPMIEPVGFASIAELSEARQSTYGALRRAVEQSSVLVFTLGLTEHWVNTQTGLEYPLCPGTVAGRHDPDRHAFRNAGVCETMDNLHAVLEFLHARNPQLRVLLTVSPVPLTATMSGRHVLTATSQSKSILRAAAGMAEEASDRVDYFPSYEIITHPVTRGMYFAPNMRSVEPAGVAAVMQHFFDDQARVFAKATSRKRQQGRASQTPTPSLIPATQPVRCEEEMLDVFAG